MALAFMLGPMEIGIILIVAVVIFGGQLPKLARSVGKALPSFKRGLMEGKHEIAEIEAATKSIADDVNKEVRGTTTAAKDLVS